ncbi:hypothetical protein Q4491_10690 [Photobacterium sp. 2_MG-2023]|uniref:Uncharacterized protein n=1 Tax=Photobacterium arenosum TaxID=2774143 RepID=A0ABR9BG13_9GAMM|nr:MULTISPECIES: hypothetical protein [Photobacterium]MBD8511148.1 hypothetical protein [Photobacterium arenosum]MBV7263211.1 hypothetical protein [Photobacterium sp. WH24]MDO6581812.1 hypothetical protein [Photobacterium sp. 2_MG-2023]
MTDNQTSPAPHTWQSGDWKEKANIQAPYNGIQITGNPQYSDNGTFISAAITITDYTNDPAGISSDIQALTIAQGQMDIPVPEAPTDSADSGKSNETTHSDPESATAPDSSNTTTVEATSDQTSAEPENSQDVQLDSSGNKRNDFTVKGWIALESNTMDIFLRVHFMYGLDPFQKEELGYIMGFSALLQSAD